MKKSAWLWVIVDKQNYTSWDKSIQQRWDVAADLVFSTPEKCKEILGWWDDKFQLVEISVPEDFDDWDFVPENY